MPVKTFRPLTPSTRYITVASFDEITKDYPERSLISIRKKSGGRNHYGRVTARGIGKGHKQFYRNVDFKRNKHGIEADVTAIEYDPLRTARLALLQYKDGEKRYILAPIGLLVGAKILSGPLAPPEVGNCLPLKGIPVGLPIHNIEITPGRGASMKPVTPRSGKSAISSTKTSFWARPGGPGIGESVRSAAASRAIPWITPMAAAPANPRAAAAGSN